MHYNHLYLLKTKLKTNLKKTKYEENMQQILNMENSILKKPVLLAFMAQMQVSKMKRLAPSFPHDKYGKVLVLYYTCIRQCICGGVFVS